MCALTLCRYIGRLGRNAFGIEVDPEKRASFVDKLLRESGHVADRETDGIEEGALLDPPAEGLRQTFLTFRIERARSAQHFDGMKNVQCIAVELRSDLKNRCSPIASRHRRELGTGRPYRDIDGTPADILETQSEAYLFRIGRKRVVMQDDL